MFKLSWSYEGKYLILLVSEEQVLVVSCLIDGLLGEVRQVITSVQC